MGKKRKKNKALLAGTWSLTPGPGQKPATRGSPRGQGGATLALHPFSSVPKAEGRNMKKRKKNKALLAGTWSLTPGPGQKPATRGSPRGQGGATLALHPFS